MIALHQKLGLVIVLLSLVGVLWSASLATRGSVSGRLVWLAAATMVTIVLQAISGTVLAITGSRPADPTHFVFGPATLLALPLALLISRERRPTAESYIVLTGWLVTFALSLRDLGTGGLGG